MLTDNEKLPPCPLCNGPLAPVPLTGNWQCQSCFTLCALSAEFVPDEGPALVEPHEFEDENKLFVKCLMCWTDWAFQWRYSMDSRAAQKLLKGMKCPHCGTSGTHLQAHIPGKEESQ